ncbi:MAG: hypothetical protein JWL77_6986 [Chthonomonadaceae bacterium]|nr:hypothetical protein [Chthonomonadaceae bacterium]
MEFVTVALRAESGRVAGSMVISRLPRTVDVPEIRDDQVTIKEGRSYRYQVDAGEPLISLEPSELFGPDDASLLSGRLLPGEAVGLVRVEARTASGALLNGTFDVRAHKFSDEQAFASMLADLAAIAVEALHQGFAAAAGAFSSEPASSAKLLYQQFAVLQALLAGGDLSWALTHLLHQPHRVWEAQTEPRPPGRPLKGSSRLTSQLARPGPRVPTGAGPLSSLPRRLMIERTEETLDTLPNRFVRFVLERWRALAYAVLDNASALPGAAMRRGTSEASRVVALLDEYLGQPLFREVGRLSTAPLDNQVLLRREGYRQVLAAANLVESSLGLDLDIEDPFLVSRKSVATLYEYWTFVKLASALYAACGRAGVEQELFKASEHGMSLVLRANTASRLRLEASVGGQPLLVDLFFNNEFRSGSWTRPMRPDASIVIRRPGDREVWLHFDAKYRVDWSQPFDTGDSLSEEAAERVGDSKRTDLLKMHAYRDAIRNSAGSYVLFPGSEAKGFRFSEQEFLPGLGAFPVRPDRANEDVEALERFLKRALAHVAAAATRHRRATYWSARAYGERGTASPLADVPLDLPPADAQVLLGHVRSDEQWRWIERTGLYNVRGGGRRGAVSGSSVLLESPLLLLYGHSRMGLFQRVGSWDAASRDSMQRLGYPAPRGETYLIAPVRSMVQQPPWLTEVDLASLRPEGHVGGQPFACSWLDLVLSTQQER